MTSSICQSGFRYIGLPVPFYFRRISFDFFGIPSGRPSAGGDCGGFHRAAIPSLVQDLTSLLLPEESYVAEYYTYDL